MDGKAINTSRKAGSEVQNISVSWDSRKYRLIPLDDIESVIIIRVREVIEVIKIIVWS